MSHRFLELNRRAFFGGIVAAALIGPAYAGGKVADDQAEWPQNWQVSADLSIGRETTPTLSPATVAATENAITQYQGIVDRGGWNPVPGGHEMRLGARGRGVEALRQRLAVTGDLGSDAGTGATFDSFVEAGVRHFQIRHGLSPSGVVDDETLKALNVPAADRLRQLQINVVRLRSYSGDLGERFVMVNLPAASVETVEGGQVYTHHKAGVGRIDRQSPIMHTRALDINFNPYWHVPPSLIKKDLIPKMKADPNYLTEEKIHVIGKDGQEVSPSSINWNSDEATHFSYRQDPGGDTDALGAVRININNPYGVYMHDTPEKGVFGDDFRFVSSGCVRVQDVRDYVAWLLKDNPGWGRDQIDDVIRSGQRTDVKLSKPVDVYWVYITAWATPDGIVQFRPDIYKRDGDGPGPMADATPDKPMAIPQD
jgi:murein L,D-transpeptidase YcbB/YkuD